MTIRMLAALGALAVISSAPRTDMPDRPEGYRVATLPTLAQKSGHDPLKDSLIAFEKESWQAWQRRDGAFFQTFLSDDHVEVGFWGVAGKAAVVASGRWLNALYQQSQALP